MRRALKGREQLTVMENSCPYQPEARLFYHNKQLNFQCLTKNLPISPSHYVQHKSYFSCSFVPFLHSRTQVHSHGQENRDRAFVSL